MRAPARHTIVHRRPRPGRRIVAGAAAGVALLGTMSLAAPAGAQDPDAGKGSAYAQGLKVDPQQGQLSFGITYGQALAGHQNTQAIAEARSLDLGVIGVTLAGEGCDGGDPTLSAEQQPQPLVSRTDAEGGSKSNQELGVDRSVNSASDPLADALSVVAGAGEPGVAVIGAVSSHATSGVIDGKRVARAVTDVASIGIPGVLEITGLHWAAEYQTAPEEATVTDFSIDGLRVADTSLVGELLAGLGAVELPLVDIADPLGELERVNELLTPLGITITAPASYVESGIAFVDPLRISIAPRNQTIGDLFTLIQPVREAITESLIALDCGNATYITVADLVVGSVTGAGSLNLEFGGVTATSGEIDIFEFELPDLPAVPPLPATPPTALGPVTLPDTGFTPAPPVTTGGDDTDEVAAAPEPVSSTTPLDGVRGGAMLGVGLGVLALLGALAEGDRRKMRRAQRSTPLVPLSPTDVDQGH